MPDSPRDRQALPRLAGAGLAAVFALTLAGCMVEPDTSSPSASESGYSLPETSLDGFTQVPLYFVGIQGNFPPATTGHEVACGDLLIRRQSVPVKTEDVATTALEYLIHDEYYSHGDPALTNSLAFSNEDLELEGLDVQGDTVTVRLTGELTTRSECESYRIRAQLHSTAADASGVQDAEILLNGVDLDEHLGLSPFELGPEITTPDLEPSPSASAETDSAGGTEDPVIDSTDGPLDESTQAPDDHDPAEDHSREITEPGSSGTAPASTPESTPWP